MGEYYRIIIDRYLRGEKQTDIAADLGLKVDNVNRAVKIYKQRGDAIFSSTRKMNGQKKKRNPETEKAVLSLHEMGWKQMDICKELGLSHSMVSDIIIENREYVDPIPGFYYFAKRIMQIKKTIMPGNTFFVKSGLEIEPVTIKSIYANFCIAENEYGYKRTYQYSDLAEVGQI